MINDNLMVAAIQKWGIELQTDLAQEECAELIVAIAHYKRGRPGSLEKLVEEIADVKIMVSQLEKIFNENAVDEVVNQKMARLANRLNLNIFDDHQLTEQELTRAQ